MISLCPCKIATQWLPSWVLTRNCNIWAHPDGIWIPPPSPWGCSLLLGMVAKKKTEGFGPPYKRIIWAQLGQKSSSIYSYLLIKQHVFCVLCPCMKSWAQRCQKSHRSQCVSILVLQMLSCVQQKILGRGFLTRVTATWRDFFGHLLFLRCLTLVLIIL